MNTSCNFSIPVLCGQTEFGNTTTSGNDALNICGTEGTGGQRWYTFIAPENGFASLDLQNAGTNYDTQVHVYTGDCNNLVCHAQNDDFFGLQSYLEFEVIQGNTYFIRIGGYGGAVGLFEANFNMVSCSDPLACNYNPLAGDECNLDLNYSCTYAVTYYTDSDLDGFGVDGSGQDLCSNPGTGYSTVSGDCDDNDPQTYPGAVEICQDGIDQDCDGVVDDSDGNGTVLNFDGQDDYFTICNPVGNCQFYSKEAWIYIEGTASAQHLISSMDAPFWLSDLKLTAGGSYNYYNQQDPNQLPLNTWVHVAMTFGYPSSIMKLYVNGNLVASGYGNLSYGYQVAVGALPNGTGFFDGRMDEVRVWGVERSQAEIQQFMNQSLIGNEPGLLRYYNFETDLVIPGGNNTSVNFTDDLANQCDGTMYNFGRTGGQSNWVAYNDFDGDGFEECADCDDNDPSVTMNNWYVDIDGDGFGDPSSEIIQCDPPGPEYITEGGDCDDGDPLVNPLMTEDCSNGIDDNCNGIVDDSGLAMSFDGNDDNFYTSYSTNSASFTKEFMIYRTSANSTQYLSFSSDSKISLSNGYVVYQDYNGYGASSNVTVPMNQWTHIAITYDYPISQVKIYINGNQVGIGNAYYHYGYGVYVGNNSSSFGGRMDEIRFWNYPRTQSEIQSNMNALLTGTESGLMRYYNFEDPGVVAIANNTAYTSTNDVTNNSDGTLSNFALNGTTSNWVPFYDADGDGYDVCTDCDDNNPSITIYAWYYDGDGDMIGGVPFPVYSCEPPGPDYTQITGDCDDSDPLINTNAIEICGNGIDDNCDGSIDYQGTAMGFDSNNDHLNTNYSSSYTSFTKEALIYTTSSDYTQYIFFANDSRVYLNGNYLYHYDACGYQVSSSIQVPMNQWVHVAVTYDYPTSSIKLYIDGVLVGTGNSYCPYGGTTSAGYNNGESFGGRMDEIRIWNYARSASQVQSTMDVALVGNESGLVRYYNFENPSITPGGNNGAFTIVDDLTNNSDGGLNNFTLDGITSNWISFFDVDGDGISTCEDCDDNNASIGIITWYPDNDGDGYGDSSAGIDQCDPPGPEYTTEDGDCNDADANVSPGAQELCSNGIDDNCNGVTDDNGIAMAFDGSNDYSYISYPPIGYTSYTKEAWINHNGNYYQPIICSSDAPFWLVNGYLNAGGQNSYQNQQSSIQVPPNTWTHVAVTYNYGTSQMTLYINGVQVAQGNGNYSYGNESWIGYFNQYGVYFGGKMDEVRVWNYARSASQIAASMNLPLIGNESGLVRYYNFENNAVTPGGSNGPYTVVDDLSTSNYDAPLYNFALNGLLSNWIPRFDNDGDGFDSCDDCDDNNPSITIYTWYIDTDGDGFGAEPGIVQCEQPGPEYVLINSDCDDSNASVNPSMVEDCTNAIDDNCNGVINEAGMALNFDGSNDYVYSNYIINQFQSFTKEAWIYRTSNNAYQYLIFGSYNPFWMYNGQLTAGDNNNYWILQDPNPIPLHTWTHVAVTYNISNSSLKLYKNGNLIASGTSSYSTNGGSWQYLGSNNGSSDFFGGRMDNVRMWNYELTQTQIQSNMNAALSGNEPGLMMWYNFENMAAIPAGNNAGLTSVEDVSQNAYDGSLNNFQLNGPTSNWVPRFDADGDGWDTCTDCDDNNPSVTMYTWYPDLDGDGYGDNSGAIEQCEQPGLEYTQTDGDCNDGDAGVNPDAEEICNNGIDENCNGDIDDQSLSMNFDGSDDYISTNNYWSYSSWTKESWIFMTSGDYNQYLFFDDYSRFYIQGGYLYHYNPCGYGVGTSTPVPVNQWAHVAVTYNYPSNQIYIYLNGTLVGNGYTPCPYGGYMNIGYSNGESFGGRMDEVRIWNTYRTQEEIQTSMNTPALVGNEPNLVRYYNFEDATAVGGGDNTALSTTQDLTNNYNGYLNNFVKNGPTSNWVPYYDADGDGFDFCDDCDDNNPSITIFTWYPDLDGDGFGDDAGAVVSCTPPGPEYTQTDGDCNDGDGAVNPDQDELCNGIDDNCDGFIDNLGIAMAFDGNNDHFYTSFSASYAPFTKEARIFIQSNNSIQYIFWSNDSRLYIQSGYLYHQDYCGYTTVSTSQIPMNQWVHVAVTFNYSNSQIKLYADGIEIGSGNSYCPYGYGTYVGYSSSSFGGRIDDVSIWNYTKTQTEIQTDVNTTFIGNETGLMRLYNFENYAVTPGGNNSSYTTVDDLSSSNYDSGLQNFTLNGNNSNWVSGADADGDGINICEDCDDNDASIGIVTWWPDNDGDGFGDMIGGVIQCDTPGEDYVLNFDDCNDADPSISPSTAEICDNGIDDNCDGDVDFQGIALNFDGSNDYVFTNHYMSSGTSFTKEAWIYRTSSSAYQHIFSSYSNRFWMYNGNLYAGDYNNEWLVSSANPIPLNTWTHVACTYNYQESQLKIYINGVLAGSVTSNYSTGSSSWQYLGSYEGGSYFFGGRMDDVKLWNYDRSATEISNDMLGQFTGNETGLVFWYNFENPSVTPAGNNAGYSSVDDASVNSYNGNLNNFALDLITSNWVWHFDADGDGWNTCEDCDDNNPAVTMYTWYPDTDADGYGDGNAPIVQCEQPGPDYTLIDGDCNDGDAGVSPGAEEICDNGIDENCNGNIDDTGLAMSFDGDNDNIYTNYYSAYSSFTKEAMIFRTSNDYNQYIFFSNDSRLYIQNGYLYHYDACGYQTSSNIEVPMNQWTHVAVTYTYGPQNLRLYINGVEVGSGYSYCPYGNNTYIGYSNGESFGGRMDEVRIWNYARTQAEIASTMNSSLTGSESGLMRLYNFEDPSITPAGNNVPYTTTNDLTNNYDGQLSNFTLLSNTSNWVPYFDMDGDGVDFCDDCDDNNPNVTFYTWYLDSDDDGFGTLSSATVQCDPPGDDWVLDDGDCDDTNINIYPGAIEICDNGIDDNCNGIIDDQGIAMAFDGSNDYSYISYPPIGYTSYTKEAWIYRQNNNTYQPIICSTDAPFWLVNGYLAAGGQYNYTNQQSPMQVPINTWTHVAMTYNYSTSQMILYINGVQVAQGSGNYSYGNETWIGYFNQYGAYFGGRIDEVRIWNYVRTPSEIATYLNATLTGSESGLVRYYNYENLAVDPGGNNAGYNTADDLSSSNYDAPLYNFTMNGNSSNWVPRYDADGDGLDVCEDCNDNDAGITIITWYPDVDGDGYGDSNAPIVDCNQPGPEYIVTDGDCNDADPNINPGVDEICDNGIDDNCNGVVDDQGVAMRFDGGNDYINTNYYLNQYTSFTKELWVNPSSTNTYQALVTSNSNMMWLVNLRPTIGDINSWYQIQDPNPLPLNEWSHVAMTYDHSIQQMKLYVNGNLIGSMNTQYGSWQGYYQYAGSYNGNDYFFGGKMDDIRIWNYALTQSEIQANLNSQLSGSEPGLNVLYTFENPSVIPAGDNTAYTSVEDVSVNSNNGSLSNFTLNGTTSNWMPHWDYDNDGFDICDDCDDNDPGITNIMWYADIDGDGFGDPETGVLSCTQPGPEYTTTSGDCDDSNGTAYPGAEEICNNGIDDDCDGYVDTGNLSMAFDGNDDYVYTNYSTSYQPFTKEAWVFSNDNNGTHYIFFSNDSRLYIQNGNLYYQDYCGYQVYGGTIPQGQWVHVAVTFSVYYTQIYVNGVNTGNGYAYCPYGYATCIGYGSNSWNGRIDEVKFWNYARTATQIQESMNTPLTGSEPGLVRYYNFEDSGIVPSGDNTAYIITDDLTNNYNGELNNMSRNGSTSNWVSYFDMDGDGLDFCEDCDDTNPNITIYTWYQDSDGDGFGTEPGVEGCTPPGPEWILVTGDCNDADAAVNPAATEICNGIDDDCNGLVDDTGIAIALDGNNDYLYVDYSAAYSSFTKEAWVFSNSSNYTQYIFFSNDSRLYLQGGYLYYQDYCGYTTNTGYILPQGQWVHLAVSYNYSNNQVILYADGNIVGTGNGFCPYGGAMCVGYGNNSFGGKVDDVRVWNYVRTQSEIQAAMYLELDGSESGLMRLYNFENFSATPGGDNFGITLVDDISNHYDGTLNNLALNGNVSNWVWLQDNDGDGINVCEDCDDNNPSIGIVTWYYDGDGDGYGGVTSEVVDCESPGEGWIQTGGDCDDGDPSVNPDVIEICDNGIDDNCNGQVDESGLAVHFDGSNDYIYTSYSTPNYESFTRESWIFPQSYGSQYIFWGQSAVLWLNNGYLVAGDYFNYNIVQSASQLPLNEWSHVAVSYNYATGQLKIFVNGTEVASGVSNYSAYTSSVFYVGSYAGSSNFFHGKMDEVKLWNIVRTPAQIEADQNMELGGNESGLVLYYNFKNLGAVAGGNNTGLTAVEDYSANSYTGTMNNFALDGLTSNWVWRYDDDGDGYDLCNDCDDNNPAVNPGMTEINCNGIDDNCDGTIDEGSIWGCTDPAACNYDPAANCEDGSCTYPTLWYADSDGDGLGDINSPLWACEQPDYYVTDSSDCDDTNGAVFPGAQEDPCNGIDDNCDGIIDEGQIFGCTDPAACNFDPEATCSDGSCNTPTAWYDDDDGDGFGDPGDMVMSISQPTGFVADNTDCNDQLAGAYPGGVELPCNSIDDNCNGEVDEVGGTFGCTDPAACNFDGLATCEDNTCTYPTAWYLDNDGDGYGSLTIVSMDCTQPSGYSDQAGDCNDNDALVSPGAVEIGCNGIDDNCNGNVDETGIAGCTDASAFNFNAAAQCDDGSCIYAGCLYPGAINYNPAANVDDGSCIFSGCTNALAPNYNPLATIDDGSCLPVPIYGCTYSDAFNYSPTANVDDGSCIYEVDTPCPGDLDNNGFINVSDILMFMQYFGTACP